jgi:hypothetical protein
MALQVAMFIGASFVEKNNLYQLLKTETEVISSVDI